MSSGEPALSIPPTRWSVDELIPFGKYILLNKISSGATAAVYRAKIRGEAGFERLVTIKRILPQMAGDPEFVETFVREAKVCARLTHSNICPIYELGKVGESLYMALEFVAGKDLRAILQRLQTSGRVMPPLAAAWIASRLCDALDYAHGLKDAKGERLNLLHQDLSPANIIVSYEGAVKLLDFGLARATGRAQQTNVDALKQKLGYMSPESVLGTPLDRRSDLFGVGVCLYEMVTGKRLFAGADDIATLKLLRNATVPPPSAMREDTPEELELIIMRSLARDPEQRWPSAGEMAHALTSFVVADDPSFGTRNLAELMQSLFDTDRQSDQTKLNSLLGASQDANLMEQRRRFFASPLGAAAVAKAEATRKLTSTRPPPPNSAFATPQGSSVSASPESLTGSHISERKARPPQPASKALAVPPPAGTTTVDMPAFPNPEDDALTTYRPPLPAATETPRPKPPGLETPRPGAFPRSGMTGMTTEETYNELIRRSGQNAGEQDDAEPTMYRPEPSARAAAESGEARENAEAGRITQPSIDPGIQELQNEPTVFELDASEYSEPIAEPEKPAAKLGPSPTPNNADEVAVDFESEATNYIGARDGKGQPAAALALFEAAAAQPPKPSQNYEDEATHIFFSADDSELSLPDVPDEELTTVSPPLPLRVSVPRPAAPAPAGRAQSNATGAHKPVAVAPAPVAPTNTFTISSIPPPNRAPLYWVLGVALLVLLIGLVLKTPLGITLGLRTPPTGIIDVRTTPAVPASVRLDGIYRGHAPMRLEGVPNGVRALSVTADGYDTVTLSVTVEGGATRHEMVSLKPTAPAPLATP